MQPSTAILLLLFGNALPSAAQDCLQLPDVPNAMLLDRKPTYEKGDVITFNCNVGYTGRQARHVCTDSGWIEIQKATCSLKPCVLPDDIPNGYFQIIRGDDFVFGADIQYFCNEGYQMVSKEATRTCMIDGWSNHLPVCEALSCDAPLPVPGIIVEGLPMDDRPILPDRFLTFSCQAPGSMINGSKTLVCGKDGKWDNPFPNCVEISCELPAPNPNLHISGAVGNRVAAGDRITVQCVTGGRTEQVECLPSGTWSSTFPTCREISCELPAPNRNLRIFGADGNRVAAGGRITVQCVTGGRTEHVECLPSGTWSSIFPTCRDTCDVALLRDSLLGYRNVRQYRTRESFQPRCKERSHVLSSTARVTCLENGQWSPLPSCTDGSCGSPPSLDNGDFIATGTQFEHNTRVPYLCQDQYKRHGGPYKTCFNGEWIGEITCLKPCTINPDLMVPNKLKFMYKSADKLYAPHEDHITFSCIDGATPENNEGMRRQCVDGVMELPRCV